MIRQAGSRGEQVRHVVMIDTEWPLWSLTIYMYIDSCLKDKGRVVGYSIEIVCKDKDEHDIR